jgi:LmbE family N-acetylglucosaminyl deacetylase
MASGIIYEGKRNGDAVEVVVMTNGDALGKRQGYVRESETISAMAILGLNEDNIVFLGYGDGSLVNLYRSSSEVTVVTSKAGETRTYANRGLGRTDFHTYLHGKPGDYNRRAILEDLDSVLRKFHPDDIYTTSFHDDHLDHKATYGLLVEALLRLIRSGSTLRPRVHETFVHAPGSCTPGPNCSSMGWPRPVFPLGQPFPEPAGLHSTAYRWDEIENVPVPAVMQQTDQSRNLKYQAISAYASQAPPPGHSNWLQAFVKKNEFFWIRDFSSNLAPEARVSASSERSSGQSANKAVDGIAAGSPLDANREWVSRGERTGAWLKLSWKTPVTVSHIELYDRPSPTENILAGALLFSDGSSVAVPALPENGQGLLLDFAPRTVSWIKLRIDRTAGQEAGLSEIEVFGRFVQSPANAFPRVVRGPVPSAPSITAAATTNLSVEAFDVEGTALRYTWSTDLGAVVGKGTSALFQAPPTVAENLLAAVTVAIQNEHGTVRNSAFIKIATRRSWLNQLGAGLAMPLKWLWHFLRNTIGKLL